MGPKKIQAITNWATSQVVHDVLCFLVFANFYQIFIKNYSQATAPLTHIICKDKLELESEKGF